MNTLFRWREMCVLGLALLGISGARAAQVTSAPVFEVSFPASAHTEPITGRLLLMLSRENVPEVRYQVGWVNSPPTFGLDVHGMRPGQIAVFTHDVPGYPIRRFSEIPTGDYFVQAVLNVYTEFHRSDGRVLWAHNDQWEGQRFNRSPGNLYSKPQRVHIVSARTGTTRLDLTEVIPPVQVPADTAWVKHVRIQSKLLTSFWGQPMYLGGVVLLPRDYAVRTHEYYPVVYKQGHFSHNAPFDFSTEKTAETDEERREREALGLETGYEFYRSWSSDDFPRVVLVTLLHPTPFYDNSYAVNSENNGPYGDALMTELIPYVETHFRILRESHARLLTGGSAGGWEALALQLHHPKFFGGAWIFYPDPVDFRRYMLVDIYRDTNAFVDEGKGLSESDHTEWLQPVRPFMRGGDGQPRVSVRQLGQLEAVLGSHGRSGQVLANWEAVFAPAGPDGYPRPLWDGDTGTIDPEVARSMRDRGYDLREFAQSHWTTIGPDLVGKLHFYCGDSDNFYLNLAVYLMEDFLKSTTAPSYGGSFQYGRPMKEHGWQPMTNAELIRMLAKAGA